MGVGPIFEGWERVQKRLLGRLPALGPEELGLREVSLVLGMHGRASLDPWEPPPAGS